MLYPHKILIPLVKARLRAPWLTAFLISFLITGQTQADPNAMNPPRSEPVSAIELSNQLIRNTDAYLEEIGRLETVYGPYDRALLEPLQALAETQIARRNYESASELWERSLQIIRVEDGLESLSQLPILEAAIENDIRLGHWSEASERFETIYHLMSNSSEQVSIEMLRHTTAMKNWYLHAILLDSPDLWEKQGNRIGELQHQLMADASSLFADDPESLIPWLYQDTIDEHRALAVHRIRSHLGKAPGITLTEKLFRSQSQSVATTFSNMRHIRKILADLGDQEGEAMAMVYQADLRLLMGKGSAPFLYRAAMDKFEEAGISPDKIDEFFSRPAIVPRPAFYRTLEAAMSAQDSNGYMADSVSAGDNDEVLTYELGKFVAWHAYLPGIERPSLPDVASNLDLDFESVRVSFSLNSRGQPRDINVVEPALQETQSAIEAVRSVKALRFRPQFVDRRWQSLDKVSLTYHYPQFVAGYRIAVD